MQPPQSPSSRGLGHRPFTAVTGVRIPVGTPHLYVRLRRPISGVANRKRSGLSRAAVQAAVGRSLAMRSNNARSSTGSAGFRMKWAKPIDDLAIIDSLGLV